MCYFLYGCVNEKANSTDLKTIQGKRFRFTKGDVAALEVAVNSENFAFRLTDKMCDCDTEIGNNKYDSTEVKDLAEYIENLKSIRNIGYVCIVKSWAGDSVEKTQSVHIDDIEPIPFLADINEKCLYKICFFKRHWLSLPNNIR